MRALGGKKFYLRSIGYICTLEALDHFEQATKTLFIIAQQNTIAQSNIAWINDRVRSFKFQDNLNLKDFVDLEPCQNKNGECSQHSFCDDINEPQQTNFASTKDYMNELIDQTESSLSLTIRRIFQGKIFISCQKSLKICEDFSLNSRYGQMS